MNLEPFKTLLLDTCGFTFSNDREQTLRNGLTQRIAARKINSLTAYHELLTQDQAEMDALVELLTVNETYFFREPDQLRLMIDKLIPELMKKGRAAPIRIVSAGCSTGEEPYSIAMLLHDKYGAESLNLFSIVGVDIDSTAISSALKGVYNKHSFRGMDSFFLEQYFVPLEHKLFRIKEIIRKHVYFQIANLNAEPYPPAVWNPDIILYRNVSIYFHSDVQRSIFSRLAET
ncbi:MAG: protein-glutamate O-methyltransferase CheR, partial [Desulfamplus sp.]|nr:protein-glutamate O-methyltransferase CheR [Desulfamplus sp.]